MEKVSIDEISRMSAPELAKKLGIARNTAQKLRAKAVIVKAARQMLQMYMRALDEGIDFPVTDEDIAAIEIMEKWVSREAEIELPRKEAAQAKRMAQGQARRRVIEGAGGRTEEL